MSYTQPSFGWDLSGFPDFSGHHGGKQGKRIRLQGRIHTSFHCFTEGGQKHGKGDFEGSKSKKFPGEHAPGTPQKLFCCFGNRSLFYPRFAPGLLVNKGPSLLSVLAGVFINTRMFLSTFFVIAFCIFLHIHEFYTVLVCMLD